ncbi:hypothetical protein P171DRAFT_344095, partial [Karstenula rhodostoma CBS 690.94]
MTVYNTEAEFGMHGVTHLQPSAYHVSRNCEICLEPLALVKSSANTNGGDNNHTRLHAAVRINSCGHIHGTTCLVAWLKIGNTCPTCGRMLYLPAMEQPLTQQDVDALMRDLRGTYSEERIARSLARYMHISDASAAKLKQVLVTKVAMEEAKEKEKEEKERQESMLNDDDFLDSDAEWVEDEDD